MRQKYPLSPQTDYPFGGGGSKKASTMIFFETFAFEPKFFGLSAVWALGAHAYLGCPVGRENFRNLVLKTLLWAVGWVWFIIW